MKTGTEKKGKKQLSEEELIELLSPKRELDLKIQKTFEGMPEKFCVMMIEKLSEYGIINTRLFKYFTNKKMKGVYVTINKNLADLIEEFKAQDISVENTIFIDAMTIMSGGKTPAGENIHYVESPKDIVDISVLVEEAMEKIGEEKKFVILDSLSTLLVYNKPGTIEKFVHSLAAKIRAHNAQGVLILVESEKKEVISTLTQFCDKVITL